jgi:hypothetical protein
MFYYRTSSDSLASDFQRVSGVESRQRLRSAETAAVLIPSTRTTPGERRRCSYMERTAGQCHFSAVASYLSSTT